MDRAKLEALEKLLAKATHADWRLHPRSSTTVLAGDGYSATQTDSNTFDSTARNEANAELIVAAVNALPALLRLARAVVDAHQGTVSQVEWEDSDRIIPHIDKDEGDVLMWQDIAQGQRVLLLRADAADTTAGEGRGE